MSLLINGMDMPKGCFDCPCCAEFIDTIAQIREYNCQALNDIPICAIGKRRRADCPFAEIPTPHGDLVDRDDLLQYIERKAKGKTVNETLKLIYTAIKAYPCVVGKENDE